MRGLADVYGIDEVIYAGDGAYYHDAWWWCRYHFRPELGTWSMMNCVRVGPFMDEDEAQSVGEALKEAR